MNRRGFLGAMLALSAAPAIVRADSLMRCAPFGQLILWGDGIHDDAAALQAMIDGRHVKRKGFLDFARESDGSILLRGGMFALGAPIILSGARNYIADCQFKTVGDLSNLIRIRLIHQQNTNPPALHANAESNLALSYSGQLCK